MDFNGYEHLLVNTAGTHAYIVDIDSHELLHMSDAAMQLYGLTSPEEYRGKICHDVLADSQIPCSWCNNLQLTPDRTFYQTRYNPMLKKWTVQEIYLREIEGRRCRVEVVRMVSDDYRRLNNQIPVDSVLLELARVLTMGDDIALAAEHFLEVLGDFYCSDRALIIEYDSVNGSYLTTFAWLRPGFENINSGVTGELLPAATREMYAILRQEREFFFDRAEATPVSAGLQRFFDVSGLDSVAAVPLYGGSELHDRDLFGFIVLDNPRLNLETRDRILRAAADFFGAEIERKRLLAKLHDLSYVDRLTGVFNRNSYIEELQRRYLTHFRSLGFIKADIDGLDDINKRFGYTRGDEVIIRTAHILRDVLGVPIYRLGGDLFIAPCPDMDNETFFAKLAELQAAFAAERDFRVSLGYSWGDDGIDIDALLSRADERMNSVKQYSYYMALQEGRRAVAAAVDVLREIENGRFTLWYQPKFHLSSGEFAGAEALIRRIDADGTVLPPARFLPRYEAMGAVIHLDLFALREALCTVSKFAARGIRLPISVNFCRGTLLLPDFVQTLTDLCRQYDVPAELLTLEVTENVSEIGMDVLETLMQEMRGAGFRFSMDDFGREHSNLSLLSVATFDEIKFDRSLVADIESSARTRTVLKNTVRMMRELGGVHLVAEGIENATQRDMLRDMGIDVGQGYLFSRPLDLDGLTKLLCDQR
ncbi:MAG: GGDEF domain-containing protein [Clostridia bacterium]|nr:GGDEF domain-containing protein [Clostridia bacterium]